MSDNTLLNSGTGGDTIRGIDKGGIKTQVTAIDVGGAGTESLWTGTVSASQSGTWTVQQGGSPWSVSVSNFPATQAVTGTFWQATQPVSAASLPLPSGAATSAKQPALGTAGSASSDVLTVQGIASMTALKVDGSGVTQPVSGTFWQATQPVSIASMPTTPVTGTFWQATQPVSGTVTANQGTAGAAAWKVDGSAVTQPVSGTFWQATQPVSIAAAVTVSQATASSLNATVTGTVAATQSGTWTNTQGAGAAAGTSWRVKGDQARASATIADPVVIGGRATDYPASTPTAVSAGQVVDMALDLKGVQVVRPRQIPTYVAIYRLALAAASSTLTFTFTANTDKQLATIYHAATATKRVSIRRVWVQILKTGAVAGELQLELRRLSATTAPATGNPAITPIARDSSAAAAEATCLSLPTTAGSETLSNSPMASSILNLAASTGTAGGTGLLPQDPMWIKLYDEASADDEEVAPIMRAGVAEGYAVIGRSTAAIPLNFIVRVVFSEE